MLYTVYTCLILQYAIHGMVVRISSTHLALYCVNIAFLHILPSSVANRTLAMPMAIGLVEIMFIDDLHKYHNASLYTQS